MDPRLNIIDSRFEKIDRVVAIAGGKGGIGKSSVAVVSALVLSRMGYSVGLLDMDFFGPCSHIILGMEGVYPEEDKGIIPPLVHGISFMSIVYYTGDNPSPMRGADVCNCIIELLAITLWGHLDFLVIDMPPGTGDATLDTMRLIKKSQFVVLTAQSRVVSETVSRELKLFEELEISVIGLVENMKVSSSTVAKKQAKSFGVPFLGAIGMDKKFEDAGGNPGKLLQTEFAHDVNTIWQSILGQ